MQARIPIQGMLTLLASRAMGMSSSIEQGDRDGKPGAVQGSFVDSDITVIAGVALMWPVTPATIPAAAKPTRLLIFFRKGEPNNYLGTVAEESDADKFRKAPRQRPQYKRGRTSEIVPWWGTMGSHLLRRLS
ncbi:hypothetical protein JB92DRAFT_2837880 [Gautieria morchelliformis]|nr:hypothetical protein JB92DRAFT_2837880 [Gautieria morchelliformis]